MKIEQEMWNRVTEFIQKRYPEDWGGAYHWTNAYSADELEQFEKLDLDLK